MTPEEWQTNFIDASGKLGFLAADGMRTGDDVTELEGELLELLDDLELIAGSKVSQKEW